VQKPRKIGLNTVHGLSLSIMEITMLLLQKREKVINRTSKIKGQRTLSLLKLKIHSVISMG